MIVELLIPVINASDTGHVTGSSLTLAECRKALTSDPPDVLLLDINMSDGNDSIFCAEIHRLYPHIK